MHSEGSNYQGAIVHHTIFLREHEALINKICAQINADSNIQFLRKTQDRRVLKTFIASLLMIGISNSDASGFDAQQINQKTLLMLMNNFKLLFTEESVDRLFELILEHVEEANGSQVLDKRVTHAALRISGMLSLRALRKDSSSNFSTRFLLSDMVSGSLSSTRRMSTRSSISMSMKSSIHQMAKVTESADSEGKEYDTTRKSSSHKSEAAMCA